MWELYHGGWAAPNIFFLGAAGCVRFGGLRIAGLSGIYKQVCDPQTSNVRGSMNLMGWVWQAA